MAVRVVTDSTADLPPEIARELGVSVVPLTVIFGDETFLEGIDMSTQLFYERLVDSKELPKTAAPSSGQFIEAYEDALKEADEVLSIHISSKLSATHNNAVLAANQLADTGAKVEVVDSGLVSLGLGLVVQAAARAAQEGGSLEEVRKLVEEMIPRVHIIVALNTLEYLRRGGRIGRARAFLGSVLAVKPLLAIRDGEVAPEERVRTKKAAHQRLFQIATSYPNIVEFAIAYSTNASDAEELRAKLAEAEPQAKISMSKVGPVIGVHGGPGVLGVGILQGE